jgi:hypothetical protein
MEWQTLSSKRKWLLTKNFIWGKPAIQNERRNKELTKSANLGGNHDNITSLPKDA